MLAMTKIDRPSFAHAASVISLPKALVRSRAVPPPAGITNRLAL
jgi:hypothetical protein